MKKILFIAGTLGKGGAERQLYYICKLLQSDYQITIISLTKGEYYESLIKQLGVKIIYVGKKRNRFIRLFTIIKKTKEIRPNYIFSFHFYTNFYAAITGRLLFIKSYGSIRGNGFHEKENNGLFSWLHYTLPAAIVANSEHGLINAKKAFYNRKIELLPNYIDTDYFKRTSTTNNKVPIITFIGRLYDVKQPHLFIKIVKKLVDNNFPVKGEIIGEGPLKNQLVNSAKELPITFFGVQDDVRPFLLRSDCLISTSRNEGTPNVMLEAMASEVPILALYHNGLNNWIKKGLLPHHKSIGEVVDFLQYNLLSFEKDRLISNKEYLEKEHSNQKILSVLNKLFS